MARGSQCRHAARPKLVHAAHSQVLQRAAGGYRGQGCVAQPRAAAHGQHLCARRAKAEACVSASWEARVCAQHEHTQARHKQRRAWMGHVRVRAPNLKPRLLCTEPACAAHPPTCSPLHLSARARSAASDTCSKKSKESGARCNQWHRWLHDHCSAGARRLQQVTLSHRSSCSACRPGLVSASAWMDASVGAHMLRCRARRAGMAAAALTTESSACGGSRPQA